MKLVITSDSHGELPEINSTGDLFIHAGDICNNYSRDFNLDALAQSEWMLTIFLPWITKIANNFTNCLCIFGNHDRVGERQKLLVENGFFDALPKNVRFLTDETVEIDGHKIYGTPWINLGDLTPGRWAFAVTTTQLNPIRNKIPSDTQILITHSPPQYILDEPPHYGDPSLNDRIQNLDKLKLVIFGHTHLDGGKTLEYNGINYVNAAQNIMEYNI